MKVALISCVSMKDPEAKVHPVPARDLYVSPLFRKAWRYAEQVIRPDRVYILSALHGLVSPDTQLMDYNKTLIGASVAERRRWAAGVLESMRREGIDLRRDEIYFLAGNAYRQYLAPECSKARFPYEGQRGIGAIMHFLDQHTK